MFWLDWTEKRVYFFYFFFGIESEGSLGIEEERGWTFKYGGS
jgi:hypothetical protein